MNPEFDLYFWPTPNGYKVAIMLEELEAKYRLVPINITKGEQHQEQFRRISPNHKIPALTHFREGEDAPVHLFESGAILLYLGDWAKKLVPVDPKDYRDCLMWLMWQMASLGPMAGQAHHFLRYAPEDVPYAKKRYLNECQRLYGVLENRLGESKFVAGEYSIADIAILTWVYRHERHEIDLAKFPGVSAWYQSLLERPSVRKGFALGDELIEQGDFTSSSGRYSLFGWEPAES